MTVRRGSEDSTSPRHLVEEFGIVTRLGVVVTAAVVDIGGNSGYFHRHVEPKSHSAISLAMCRS